MRGVHCKLEDVQPKRLCQDGYSYAVPIPDELSLLYYNGQKIACFDVYLKPQENPVTILTDAMTEHTCSIATGLNSRTKENLSIQVQVFFKTLSEIATINRGIHHRENFVLVNNRIFIKKQKAYCRIPKNFADEAVYEVIFGGFSSYYDERPDANNNDNNQPSSVVDPRVKDIIEPIQEFINPSTDVKEETNSRADSADPARADIINQETEQEEKENQVDEHRPQPDAVTVVEDDVMTTVSTAITLKERYDIFRKHVNFVVVKRFDDKPKGELVIVNKKKKLSIGLKQIIRILESL